eukprot:1306213-Pyramimonas_sp.AAC.2
MHASRSTWQEPRRQWLNAALAPLPSPPPCLRSREYGCITMASHVARAREPATSSTAGGRASGNRHEAKQAHLSRFGSSA